VWRLRLVFVQRQACLLLLLLLPEVLPEGPLDGP
jgi:hypothetical protein